MFDAGYGGHDVDDDDGPVHERCFVPVRCHLQAKTPLPSPCQHECRIQGVVYQHDKSKSKRSVFAILWKAQQTLDLQCDWFRRACSFL